MRLVHRHCPCIYCKRRILQNRIKYKLPVPSHCKTKPKQLTMIGMPPPSYKPS
uniref:Macaca fascicularis brain cDNA, clone: QtrA-17344 n=1 Tax=Macaca fascicularis TaxID=9541 RepID=I7GM28_MACFA|nr:unnamed protein product [Macaca fascicularis]